MTKNTLTYQRIRSLDFLRGIAILGILVINIESFCYPEPWSPFAYGFDSSIDRVSRFVVYWLAQGKFYFMLTLLFGVGFSIFLERTKNKKRPNAYQLYLKRLFWLFVIGILHAYLIWNGDILYHYAICGVILLLLEPFSQKFIITVMLILVGILMFNDHQRTTERAESFNHYVQIKDKSYEQRTSSEQRRFNYWTNKLKKHDPKNNDHEPIRKNYWHSIVTNFENLQVHKGVIYHKSILFRTLIMMLMGVLLFRSGLFHNYHVIKNYWQITMVLMVVALTVNYFRYFHWTYNYEQPVTSIVHGWLFLFPRESLALAYVLFFNGLFQKFFGGNISALVSNVGRMALTNYITQSIICGLIFYGYGMGFYNQLSRVELLPMVLIIVLGQVLFSWLWLKYHTMGPIEYLWRKMTYDDRNLMMKLISLKNDR